MYIKNGTLVLRHAELSDAEQLCVWWNDGRVMAHAGFPKGLSITAEDIREKLLTDKDETGCRLIIEEDEKAIGEMSYRITEPGTAGIGIKICDFSRQEKGIGKRVLTMLLVYLFEELLCARVVLDTNLNNLRAQHVYEQLGFRKTGVRENSWQDQLGVWQSAVDYELLPEQLNRYV